MNELISGPNAAARISYAGRISYIKMGIIAILIMGAAAATGFLLESILYKNDGVQTIAGIIPLLWPFIIAFLLLLSFSVITTLFVSRWWYMVGIHFVGASVLIGFFIQHMTVRLLIGSIAFVLLFLSAGIAGRIELNNGLKIRFFRVAKTILSRAVLACAVLIGIVFFDVFSAAPLTGDNFLLPESVFEKSIDAIGKSGLPFAGGLDLSLSLEQLTNKAVQESVNESGPIAQSIPKTMVQQMTATYLQEYQNKIKEVIGISIDPEKKISLAIYQGLLGKFNELDESAKTIALSIVALLVFLTAMALSPIIRWAAAIISFVLYRLMLLTGMGSVVYESKNKEILILP